MITLDLSTVNLSWNTRGFSWDFRFLSKASGFSAIHGSVYRSVFLTDEAEIGYFWGDIFLSKQYQVSYVGCRFELLEHRDSAGRPIPQEILLFCPREQASTLSKIDWVAPIWKKIQSAYEIRYKKEYADVTAVSEEELFVNPLIFDVTAKIESKKRDVYVNIPQSLQGNCSKRNFLYLVFVMAVVFLTAFMVWYASNKSANHRPQVKIENFRN